MSHFQKLFEGAAIGVHRIAITLQYYVYFLSHSLELFGVGRGVSPVGALPPYLPLLLLCSLTHFEYPVQQSVLVTLLAEFSKCICIFPAVETSDNIGVEAIAIILDN